MIELLTKCLKQPESNAELFYFVEDSFIHLDESEDSVVANFPLFFALHLPVFFGFRISNNPSLSNEGDGANFYLDLMEGEFTGEHPRHPHFLEGKQALVTSQILKCQKPDELVDIKLNHDFRRNLLIAYETYYALHIQDFGSMRTLPVLREILG